MGSIPAPGLRTGPERICPVCGVGYRQARAGGRPKLFCSRTCREHVTNVPNRLCATCGTPFHTYPSVNSKYCSYACMGISKRVPIAEAFWAKVDRNGPIVRPELGPCYVWTACLFSNGYAQIRVDGKTRLASHISWGLEHSEPVPAGQQVLHRCDNRPCVRGGHLFLGTHADNMADKSAKGRNYQGERHCFARFTETDIRAMRSLYSTGMSYHAIAKRYDTSATNVSEIVRRRTWKHVS